MPFESQPQPRCGVPVFKRATVTKVGLADPGEAEIGGSVGPYRRKHLCASPYQVAGRSSERRRACWVSARKFQMTPLIMVNAPMNTKMSSDSP